MLITRKCNATWHNMCQKKFWNFFRQGKFVALCMFVFFMQGHIWVANSYFWEFGLHFRHRSRITTCKHNAYHKYGVWLSKKIANRFSPTLKCHHYGKFSRKDIFGWQIDILGSLPPIFRQHSRIMACKRKAYHIWGLTFAKKFANRFSPVLKCHQKVGFSARTPIWVQNH